MYPKHHYARDRRAKFCYKTGEEMQDSPRAALLGTGYLSSPSFTNPHHTMYAKVLASLTAMLFVLSVVVAVPIRSDTSGLKESQFKDLPTGDVPAFEKRRYGGDWNKLHFGGSGIGQVVQA
ncbi:hypothetical protein QCA50_019853 [Cerrena zonata]|uniref:Uncharacterized protein n=1 Tax=Cerrena zonata TaxID=2478898 RepID=A0AAW0FCV6_9APHY